MQPPSTPFSVFWWSNLSRSFNASASNQLLGQVTNSFGLHWMGSITTISVCGIYNKWAIKAFANRGLILASADDFGPTSRPDLAGTDNGNIILASLLLGSSQKERAREKERAFMGECVRAMLWGWRCVCKREGERERECVCGRKYLKRERILRGSPFECCLHPR